MAIKLLNTNQYADFGDILKPIPNNYTLCCWFYPTDLSSWKMIFGCEDLSGPGFHLEINNSQKPGFHSSEGTVEVFGTTTIELNTWYHITGVRDGSSGNQKIYINSILEGTGVCGTISTVTSPNRIGKPFNYPTQGIIGIVDDIRFYDRALSDSEIETIYACQGCDNIFYGMQFRFISSGAKDQQIGSISDIAVNNVQSAQSSVSASSLTLNYTVPTGTNLILVVSATAESTYSGRVMPTNITFNGNALTNQAEDRTTTSAYNGVGLWSKTVTSGESGDIVVTWGGSNSRRTVMAYVLNGANGEVEATATAFNNTGTTTADITTVSDKAIIVTVCANKDGYTMTAVGTNHNVDATLVAGAHAGAMGHITTSSAGSNTGIGFTASPTPTGEALALAVFSPYNSIEEISDNKYKATVHNGPTYEETFLKLRRF